ncbi:3754_t:CDS:2 [Cetraspora pellucida]|uniref:3754_t:CDS:1 n=1 Tax=Cetraspora pellucida TaxID=1433469 RepID=A0ACA9LR29_9GLOM|nr:3754_t:CDS:2 [Cetraspora pellucida]
MSIPQDLPSAKVTSDLEKQNEELKKQVEVFKNQIQNPKSVAIIISEMCNNPNQKRKLTNELDNVGIALRKKSKRKVKVDVNKDLWKEGLQKSALNSIIGVLSKIHNSTLKEIDWNTIKNDYEQQINKASYIKGLAEKRFNNKKSESSHNRNLESSPDQIKLQRFEYYLLGNYIIKNDTDSKEILKSKKFNYKCYERVANLHDIIGKYIVKLPFNNIFFDGSYGDDNEFIKLICDNNGTESAENNEIESEDNSEEFNDNKEIIPDKDYDSESEGIDDVIRGLKDVLLEIVDNEDLGYYRKLAMDTINVVDLAKSHTPMLYFNTFDQITPGYYGAKGLLIISEMLQNMFINIINRICKPQTPNQFLFDVLVPETAIQLIIEDYEPKCNYDDMQKIMNQSSNYGMATYLVNDEN